MDSSSSSADRSRRWIPGSSLTAVLLVSVMLVPVSGCSVFGVESVEEAPYQLVQKEEQFEIREYAGQVVAETRVSGPSKEAGNKAFRTLFAYISGENEASEEIAMTSPVISEERDTDPGEEIAMTAPVMFEKEGKAWRYQFVLPSTYSLASAPRPSNPDVVLVEIPPRRVATLRYAGRATVEARERNTDVLLEWLESNDQEPQSDPRWAGYNAPWTLPPFRRNEVMIDLSSDQSADKQPVSGQ